MIAYLEIFNQVIIYRSSRIINRTFLLVGKYQKSGVRLIIRDRHRDGSCHVAQPAPAAWLAPCTSIGLLAAAAG